MEQTTLLNYRDLAKILQRSENTLRVDVMNKRIPFVRLGRQIRFDPEVIQKWLESKRVPEIGGKG